MSKRENGVQIKRMVCTPHDLCTWMDKRESTGMVGNTVPQLRRPTCQRQLLSSLQTPFKEVNCKYEGC